MGETQINCSCCFKQSEHRYHLYLEVTLNLWGKKITAIVLGSMVHFMGFPASFHSSLMQQAEQQADLISKSEESEYNKILVLAASFSEVRKEV